MEYLPESTLSHHETILNLFITLFTTKTTQPLTSYCPYTLIKHLIKHPISLQIYIKYPYKYTYKYTYTTINTLRPISNTTPHTQSPKPQITKKYSPL